MDKSKKNMDVAVTKTAEQSVAPSATQSSPDAKKKPATTIRVDDCSASIWARERVVQGKPHILYSVTFERSYKDRDGGWKYTRSFDADSVGKVVSLCEQVTETIDNLMLQDAAA